MKKISFHKVTASPTAPYAPDAVYFFKSGTGFDLLLTDSAGEAIFGLNKPSTTIASTSLESNDLKAIAALTGATGLLRKTAAGTWSLDTSAYLTGISAKMVTDALNYTPVNPSVLGKADGIATLDAGGKVPSAQLPSFVDDVVDVANFASLPATGEKSKIYLLETPHSVGGITSSQFRWSGTAYAPIAASPGSTDAVTEGSTNLYFTPARARAAVQSVPGSSGSVAGLTLTSSANAANPDTVSLNQIGYNNTVSLFGQTDGGLYSSAHSASWVHQIFGDFRTGQTATRGKNSGTWQAWRVQLDSGNFTNYVPFTYAGWPGHPGTDANSFMGGNWVRSSFTYSNNAPLTGCLVTFPAGGYDLQLNGDYSGDSFWMRSRNGDTGAWRPWKRLLTDYNFSAYAPTLTGGGASGNWNITANYSNNLTQGFNSNWNTDFAQAPAGSTVLRGDTSTGSSAGGPGGTWWFQQNMRHANGSNLWGVQVAWGWEDNANQLRARNVNGGGFGGWVNYFNSTHTIPLGNGGTGANSAQAANRNFDVNSYSREVNGGTLVPGTRYSIYTGGGAISMSMPAYGNTNNGDKIEIANLHQTWAGAAFTITCPASNVKINMLTENLVCNHNAGGFTLECVWKDGSAAYWTVRT